MSARLELVWSPLRSLRRAAFWWSVGMVVLVAATVAFWPAFRGSSGITQALDQLPSGLVQAFGLEDFGTPEGYLRGNLYEVFLPMLFAAAGVTMVSGQTAGEEAAGRLEVYLAQPVDRRAVFVARAAAASIVVIGLGLIVAIVQVAADGIVDLRIDLGHLLATIAMCALLGIWHGSLGYAVAGSGVRPSIVIGSALGVAVTGYLVAALFPLSTVLAPWRHLSPWDWAFGGDPLSNATDPWRFILLAALAAALIAVGTAAVARRDIASG